MAYRLGDSTPRPNLPGELVGNFLPKSAPGPFNSQSEAERSMPDWSKMRQGRPVATASRSTSELESEGWVGVYLTQELPLPAGAVACATPDWMREPQ